MVITVKGKHKWERRPSGTERWTAFSKFLLSINGKVKLKVTLEQTTVVIRQLRSNLDFGPVVKPLGITVKKEGGKVVETSGDENVVKPTGGVEI